MFQRTLFLSVGIFALSFVGPPIPQFGSDLAYAAAAGAGESGKGPTGGQSANGGNAEGHEGRGGTGKAAASGGPAGTGSGGQNGGASSASGSKSDGATSSIVAPELCSSGDNRCAPGIATVPPATAPKVIQ